MRRKGEDDSPGEGLVLHYIYAHILDLWRISTWAFWVGCYSTRLQRYHSKSKEVVRYGEN